MKTLFQNKKIEQKRKTTMKFETDPEAGVIVMRGGIGDFDGYISADDFLTALDGHSGDLTIHLDSAGGSVTDGLSIHNAIVAYDGNVTVHIDSQCCSIATVVACSADRVLINSSGKYMIHRAWSAAVGNCRDFRSMADIMEMMDKDIALTYQSKAGGDVDEWLALMDAETWLDADKALAMGLVDEIVDVRKKYKPKAESEIKVKAFMPNVQVLAQESARRLRLKLK
jgi:ATP-dependent Clp protease protease subunit